MKKKLKIAMAMSGGVDSSLAAALLMEAGHEVTGVYLDCWEVKGCEVDYDRKDAMKVGLKLGILMKVIDFKKEYKKRVMDWFFEEVEAGRTPNPDVLCNKEIKFGLFWEWAMKEGFDMVATGHYARIGGIRPLNSAKILMNRGYSPSVAINEEVRLYSAVDKQKDQTYFLATVSREKLARVVFPIGEMTKEEVRREARKRGLHVWDKKGTSGVCLVGGDLSFEDLLKTRFKEYKGEVMDMNGMVIGEHKGYEFYTTGQRHGFEVRVKSSESKPLFVVSKDRESNRLVVGEKKDLMRDSFEVGGIRPLKLARKLKSRGYSPPTAIGGSNETLRVRIRHGGKLMRCEVEPCIRRVNSVKDFSTNDIHHLTIGSSQKGFRVKLKEKVFGVAPGQVAVFYRKTVGTDPTVFECLGGGVIGG